MVPEKHIPTGWTRHHWAQQISIIYSFHVFPNTALFLVTGLIASLQTHFSPWLHFSPLISYTLLNHDPPTMELGRMVEWWCATYDYSPCRIESSVNSITSTEYLSHIIRYTACHTRVRWLHLYGCTLGHSEKGAETRLPWLLTEVLKDTPINGGLTYEGPKAMLSENRGNQ